MNNAKKYQELIRELKKSDDFFKYEEDAKVKLNLGIELLRARKIQNLSQKEISEILSTTQKVVSRIENGEVDVGICMLSRISKNLNFTTENFANIFDCEKIYTISIMSPEVEEDSSTIFAKSNNDFVKNWDSNLEPLSFAHP